MLHVTFAFVVACALGALAQAQTTAPATTSPATAPATDLANLTVTVTGIEGVVQVRENPDQPWRKCELNMVLGAGAEFRTGPRSAVRCTIPPDQTFTVDRLGIVKVLQAAQQGGKIKTDLGMQYGRTRYDIEEAGLQHESVIRSPNGTLAVRGTRVSLYDQPPFTPRATSLTGRAVYANAKRQIAFGGKGAGKTAVANDSDSAAETAAKAALLNNVIDPRSPIALSEAESQQLAFEVSRGAIRFDRLIISGFQPPPADLSGELPGMLNFAVTWTGFADIDMFVITNPNTPQQQILGNPSIARLFPGQVTQKTTTGGRIDFDKISINKGAFEIAYWPSATWTSGIYGIGAIHHDYRQRNPDYATVSNVKFEVYLNGRKIDSVLTNPDEVQNDATPILGTTYLTQTNLDTGRDTVSTVAIIPAPESTRKSAAKTTAAAKKSTPVPATPAKPATAAKPPSRRGR